MTNNPPQPTAAGSDKAKEKLVCFAVVWVCPRDGKGPGATSRRRGRRGGLFFLVAFPPSRRGPCAAKVEAPCQREGTSGRSQRVRFLPSTSRSSRLVRGCGSASSGVQRGLTALCLQPRRCVHGDSHARVGLNRCGLQGHNLLKKKSDALTIRFRAILREILQVACAHTGTGGACLTPPPCR